MHDIKFESNFTQKDYKKVSFFNVFGRKPLMFILCIVIFVMGIIAIIPNNPLGLHPLFGIIFILYPVGLMIYTNMRIKKAIKTRKIPVSEPQKVLINETNIICTKSGKRDTLTWDDITGAYESKEYFVIYTSQHRMIALPKRDVNSDDEFALRNIVINKLPFKKYRLKQ